VPFRVDQTNNSYIFPGVGLGAIAAQARRISDTMFMAAARSLAALSPSRHDPKANLLPPVTALHDVAVAVAVAVGRQAQADGLAAYTGDVEAAVRGKMWTPKYLPYRRAG
jgi:malate dehydrogenase (oxaloacetate-decarboxylating)